MNSPPAFEHALVQALADYQAQGFEVERDVVLASADGFRVRADLVASKGNEVVVVEVKRRDSADPQRPLRQLQELVTSKPGWRFELVLYDPLGPLASIPSSEALRRLVTVREVSQVSAEAAFLLAWTALEAAIRLKAAPDDARPAPLGQLLGRLAAEGAVGERLTARLRELLNSRNRAVHGFELEADWNAEVQVVSSIASALLSDDYHPPEELRELVAQITSEAGVSNERALEELQDVFGPILPDDRTKLFDLLEES